MYFFLSRFSRINFQRHVFQFSQYNLTNLSRYQSSESILNQFDSISPSSHQLNCDIFHLNKDGQLHFTQGPFDREQICVDYQLEPRDLQKIDTDLLVNVPVIDVRLNRFICFSFRRLRSLVQLDRSIFFVPSADKVQTEPYGIQDGVHWERVVKAYHRNVKYIHQLYNQRFIEQILPNMEKIPFEFRLTEINLEAVARGLKLKSNELFIEFHNIRERAYTSITIGSLRELALLKEKIDKYKRNAELAHQAIVDVLAHDEDMTGMYLTENRPRDISDHIQIELLLEACTKQMAEVRRSISDLSDSIHTLESATGFMLSAVRNELLGFEIRINIITMALAFGAFIAGIYGMNLSNGLEQNPYAFYLVTGSSFVFIGGIIAVAVQRFLRYRKIRLHRSNKIDLFGIYSKK